MIHLTLFEGEFCGKIRKIYSVNSTTPEKELSSMTSHRYCPYCGKGNFFRVYNPRREYETEHIAGSIYDSKCPHCNKDFDIIDEHDKDYD
ncbi:hypothetical protein PZQ55_002687 [Clostridium botulinum]|nr:hypothetical protein [Clostridium botulinum]EKO2043655.1 hypothetical protein [Clostridium botulinum]